MYDYIPRFSVTATDLDAIWVEGVYDTGIGQQVVADSGGSELGAAAGIGQGQQQLVSQVGVDSAIRGKEFYQRIDSFIRNPFGGLSQRA
jgi:hypothetical protein